MAKKSKQQILEKAIEKAEKNGWKDADLLINCSNDNELRGILFSHDFAKALWGEHDTKPYMDGKKCKKCGGVYLPYGNCDTLGRSCWTDHLQRMVIADDPVKYLGENI